MAELQTKYDGEVAVGHLKKDAEQGKAAAALDRLYDELTERKKLFAGRKKTKGVYIYGGVGRGTLQERGQLREDVGVKPRIQIDRARRADFRIDRHRGLHQGQQMRRVEAGVFVECPAYGFLPFLRSKATQVRGRNGVQIGPGDHGIAAGNRIVVHVGLP